MERLIDSDYIELDNMDDNTDQPYRLTLFDKNMHYVDEFFLTKEQIYDLKEGLKNIEVEIDNIL